MSLETVQGVVVKIQASESYVYPFCGNCNAKLCTQPGYGISPGLRRTSRVLTSPKNLTQTNIVTPIKSLNHIKALTPGPQMFCSRCHSNYLRDCVSFKYRLSFVLAQAQEYRTVTVFGGDLDSLFGCNATDFRKFLRVISHKTKLDKFELKNALLESLESVMLGQLFALNIIRVKTAKSTLIHKRRIPLSEKTPEYLSKLRLRTTLEEWRVRKFWPVYSLPNSVFLYLREKLNLAPDCLGKEKDVYTLRSEQLLKTLEEKKYFSSWCYKSGQMENRISPLFIQNMNVEWEYSHLDEVDISSEGAEYTSETNVKVINNEKLPASIPTNTSNPIPFMLTPTKSNMDNQQVLGLTNDMQIWDKNLALSTQGQNSPIKNRPLLQSSKISPFIHISTPKETDFMSASQTSQFFEDSYSGTPNNWCMNLAPDLTKTPNTSEIENWTNSTKSNERPITASKTQVQGSQNQYHSLVKNTSAVKESGELLVVETPENPKLEASMKIYESPSNDQTPTKSHSLLSSPLTRCRWHSVQKYHKRSDSTTRNRLVISTPDVYAIIPETPLNSLSTSKNTICMNSPLHIIPCSDFIPETPVKKASDISEHEIAFWLNDEIIPQSDEEDLCSKTKLL